MKSVYLLLVPAVLGLGGCVIDVRHSAPLEYSTETVELDDADLVRVDLSMGVGDLRVSEGTQKLMRGDFSYNVPSWKPEVQYRRAGKQGTLRVTQPNNQSVIHGDQKHRWDLQLSNKMPVELDVHFGAGEARLDLGSLQLRGVTVEMGVGQLEMDLRGAVKHSYNVSIHGGIGSATVHVPADAGIWAEAQGGIGSIHVSGLQKEGGHWISEGYARAENKIRIDVQGGIGEIRLIAD